MQLNPLSSAFGLDIGDRSMKLIQVTRHRGKNPYRLTGWGSVELPEGIMDHGQITDMDKMVASLERLLKESQGRVRGRAVAACLPEVKSFIKVINVPRGSEEAAIKKAVRTELEQNVPLPIEEIYYDWQIISETPAPVMAEPEKKADAKTGADQVAEAEDKSGTEKPADKPKTDLPDKNKSAAVPTPAAASRLLIGAAPKKIIDDYATMMERAGLAPIALEIEATAITRAIIPERLLTDEAVGILDIGATRSALIIYDGGTIQMSISIPISGLAITELVAESLKVSLDDAELLKRECGLDVNRCEDKMWRILYPLIDDITEKIRNAIRFYKIGFPAGKKIETIYLCGGGAQFREIDTVLSRKLAIKVDRGDGLTNLDSHLPKNFPKSLTLNYTTAIGLAIRAADENLKYRSSLF